MTFVWDVDWDDSVNRQSLTPNQKADINMTKEYLKSLSGHKSKFLAANNSIIAVGPQYKFTLRVRNFLGKTSKEATLTVQRQDKSLPGLDLGSKKKRVKAALDITLQGNTTIDQFV